MNKNLELALVIGIVTFALFAMLYVYSEQYTDKPAKVIQDRAYLMSNIGCLPTELTKAEFDAQQQMYLDIFHTAVKRCP